MEDNHESELDRIIDGALSGYSEAEPLAGLEQRVVNRIRIAEARRRRFRFWPFAIAAAAALLLVMTIAFHSNPVPAPRIAKTVPAPAIPASETNAPPAAQLRIRRVRRSKPIPKQRQFPAVAPLSAEERALVALANYPQAAVFSPSEDSIEIPAIEIKPLESDGSQ